MLCNESVSHQTVDQHLETGVANVLEEGHQSLCIAANERVYLVAPSLLATGCSR